MFIDHHQLKYLVLHGELELRYPGVRSVLATKTDGTLWSWGGNASGRGGTNQGPGGSNQYFTSPRQIPGTTWSLVEAGPGNFAWQLKLMEHYGDGEEIIEDN